MRFEWEKQEEKMNLEKRKKAAEYAVKSANRFKNNEND